MACSSPKSNGFRVSCLNLHALPFFPPLRIPRMARNAPTALVLWTSHPQRSRQGPPWLADEDGFAEIAEVHTGDFRLTPIAEPDSFQA